MESGGIRRNLDSVGPSLGGIRWNLAESRFRPMCQLGLHSLEGPGPGGIWRNPAESRFHMACQWILWGSSSEGLAQHFSPQPWRNLAESVGIWIPQGSPSLGWHGLCGPSPGGIWRNLDSPGLFYWGWHLIFSPSPGGIQIPLGWSMGAI